MLFQVLGPLLTHAGSTVDDRFGADDHGDLQRRRVALLLLRVGRLYPGLYGALARENQILRGTADDLSAFSDPPSFDHDPLVYNRQLYAHLDEVARTLHAIDAPDARTRLRAGLAAAAHAQDELMTLAFTDGAPR